ncbi:hypothetical protein MFIFM68171_01871 [Madurella fahalii]|uniref:Uncharacterized protein n=1 Tax=Madurella fahalii TaxID=1157608 RepID=A0ABQ0G1N2_9PEZI
MVSSRVYNNALEILKKVKAREAPPDHHVAKEIVELTARSRYAEANGVFHRSRVTVPGIVRAAKLLRRSEWDKIQKSPDVLEEALCWLNEAESVDSYHLHYLRTLQDCTNGQVLYKHFVLDLAMYLWKDDPIALIDCVRQYGQDTHIRVPDVVFSPTKPGEPSDGGPAIEAPPKLATGFANVPIAKARTIFGQVNPVLEAILSCSYQGYTELMSTNVRLHVLSDWTVEILIDLGCGDDERIAEAREQVAKLPWLNQLGRTSVDIRQVSQMRIQVSTRDEGTVESLVFQLA